MATTTRRYKDRVYHTHLLRRSYRVGRRVQHQTLGNLSHLPANLIELLRRSLAGEEFVSLADAFTVQSSLTHGQVEAVLGTMRQLRLDTLIASQRCPQRDLVTARIVERLLRPCSKLATTRLWHTSTLAQELSVESYEEDDLYDALDWLLARQQRIEKKLAQRHLGEATLVLYDVSSSYYEGSHCPLARYGHDRDQSELPIIVYGVLTDPEGRPVAVEVYPGNTGDPTTVPDPVQKLRQRFGLSRVVLVGDRGMLTQTQIEKLQQYPGLGWISALRSPSIRGLVEGGYLQLSLFDQVNLAEIISPDYPGERLIACFNPLLAEERRTRRQELLAATEKELQRIAKEVARRKRKPLSAAEIGVKVGKVLNRFKMAKHFETTIDQGVWRWLRREEGIRREGELDGMYVIRTSEDQQHLSAQDTVRHYKSLAHVERAFRCLKGIDLRVRPIYLRTPDHVRAHIFLCLLAYYVEWHMRQALAPLLFADEELDQDRRRRDPVAPASPSVSAKRKKFARRTSDGLPLHSFDTLLQSLATRTRNTCQIKSSGQTFQQLTPATPLQQRAFQLLGL
ncbi:MAG: IS1634 family transposase [Desulfovibrio sp.]|nr:IS1634 family transposase [Desulfovibrio sp.]